EVRERIGDGAHPLAILKKGEDTGKLCSLEERVKGCVVGRVFWLEGLEEGLNRGGKVDSHERDICIHGTNSVDQIGMPSSEGCIRMRPSDMVDLFNRAQGRTWVYIS